MCHVKNGKFRTFLLLLVMWDAVISGGVCPAGPGYDGRTDRCGKLEARRAVVFAAMAERPGHKGKDKKADDFDALLPTRLGGVPRLGHGDRRR